ncbi:MAG: AI-2E family transporter [Archangium sp.]|nr:AI-2E family transporter [Archangium sp.]MDP3572584.1 AI-2E family transporter [Archangium sp.]
MTPLRWTTLLLCLAAVFVLWPLWPPLVLAAWTAALTRPALARFERGFKGRRRAAALFSLGLFVLLALPLALISIGVITGAQELLAMVETSPTAASALQSLLSSPESSGSVVPSSLPELFALLQRSGTQGLGLLTNVAGAAAKGLIGLFIYFAGAYTYLLESEVIWHWVKRHSPLEGRHLQRLGEAFHETGRGLLVGVGLTSATQGLAATIIYASLGVPRAWVLGPITGIVSIIPVVGTSIVWVPISVGLFLTGKPVHAAVLVVLGLTVIGLIDNFLRPIYARMGSLKMPLYLLFLAVFGGLAAFGTWGALIGPLVVRLAMEVLTISREEKVSPEKVG